MELADITRREFNRAMLAAGAGFLLGGLTPRIAQAQDGRFYDIVQDLKNYIYSMYDQHQGNGVIPLSAKEDLQETLKKYGFKKEAKIILNEKSEPVPQLSRWFEKQGYRFSSAHQLFEVLGYDLRKTKEVKKEQREIFGKKKKFYFFTCDTPEIATFIDWDKLKKRKRLALISRTVAQDRVEWVPQSHAQLEKEWYKPFNKIESLKSAASVSLDEHVRLSGGNSDFFRILTNKLYLLAAGEQIEKAVSEDEFIKLRLATWKESVAFYEGMRAKDWFKLSEGASQKLKNMTAMHYEARAMLSDVAHADPYHALWNCTRYREGPVEYDEDDFDFREHAAKFVFDNLSKYITDNRKEFTEANFEDFDKTKKLDNVIKYVDKIPREKLQKAAKAVFDKVYEGKKLNKWLDEKFRG